MQTIILTINKVAVCHKTTYIDNIHKKGYKPYPKPVNRTLQIQLTEPTLHLLTWSDRS